MAIAIVVDDTDVIRSLLSDFAKYNGFEVLAFKDGAEAINALIDFNRVEEIKLLITDYSMPGKSGLEVLQFAKGKIKNAKLFIVSFDAPKYIIEVAKELGAEHVGKSEIAMDVEKFLEKIGKA